MMNCSSLPAHIPKGLFLASLLVALPLTARAQGGPRIAGITAVSPLVVSQNMSSCALSQCTPAGMPPQTLAFAGGSAYDARRRTLWISDGLMMGRVDPRAACNPVCPVLPVPNTTPNNPVTGLAFNESTNQIFITDRSNIIRWYSVAGGCQLTIIARCIAPIPSGFFLSGCATDDLAGLIFYCASSSTSAGGMVYVAPQSAPCAVICSFPVTTCGTAAMGPLQGLAYDPCARRLWATDGRFTTGLDINPTSCTVINQAQCCLNTLEPYTGLAVIPSTEGSSGNSCTAPSCPNCPTMNHVLGGDPVIGSATFSLDLVNAPGQSSAVLVLNLGPAGPPVLSPPLCAGIRVPIIPPPFVGPSLPTGGTPGLCNGSMSINLPLPASPFLCGLMVSSQYFGICPPSGNYVSNCLTWVIGAS